MVSLVSSLRVAPMFFVISLYLSTLSQPIKSSLLCGENICCYTCLQKKAAILLSVIRGLFLHSSVFKNFLKQSFITTYLIFAKIRLILPNVGSENIVPPRPIWSLTLTYFFNLLSTQSQTVTCLHTNSPGHI
jgi:hypothetical protein